MRPPSYRDLSLWHETTPTDWTPRPALTADLEVDVVVVGAGYTGLWTAYYLAAAEPALRIAVLESQVAGFGASGRNGGWCSSKFPTALGEAQDAAMRASVDEVERVTRRERIDCHFAKGGTIVLARNAAQLARARARCGDAVLSADEAGRRLRATGPVGATYSPDCAALHPARLVRGLADAVERRGVTIFEQTPAVDIRPGCVRTPRGTVSARHVVRATEGYTSQLPRLRRHTIPVYSLIIASEPLPASVWDEIGLAHRETFADHRHLITYGQRTADDRIVYGGRGAPYHLGSRVDPRFDRDPRVFARLHASLLKMFPVLAGARFTHAWGGPLAIPRDWCASVGLDRATGLAWAGGYVGNGVATANLSGRTLTDLILGRDTDLVRLPWVDHQSPRWEPEPARWLGVNAGLRATTLADVEERLTHRPSLIARAMAPMTGSARP